MYNRPIEPWSRTLGGFLRVGAAVVINIFIPVIVEVYIRDLSNNVTRNMYNRSIFVCSI